MYEGVPTIRLEGDEKRALALIPEAKALLYRTQQVRNKAGVHIHATTHRVGKDALIYILSSDVQNIIQIIVSPDIPEKINIPPVPKVPDFYSGNVYGGLIYTQIATPDDYLVVRRFAPTPNCQQMHPDELTMGRQQVQRLVVRPYAAFSDLTDQNGFGDYSQYVKLRASMYSGRMRALAQLLMGYGRLDAATLIDPQNPQAALEDPYIQEVATLGFQVRYDWRFIRTHGITEGADGTLWLVEISQNRGVLAMPLKFFPESQTPAFRQAALDKGDMAMVRALDEFGGLPTGECFPTKFDELETQIAEGNILRLLNAGALSDFYMHSGYSSYMGWTFNERGSEAHNTGYRFADDGYQRGVWYQINIRIGKLKPEDEREPKEPIADGKATLVKQHEGYLWAPPSAREAGRFLPFKVYEPLLEGLLSHEGVPDRDAGPAPPPKPVDTVVHVAFVNDELHVIKYFRDDRQELNLSETGVPAPDECLYAGDWTVTQTAGYRSFPKMMYTSVRDDRHVLQESVTVTKYTSTDLGFDPPKFSDFIEAPAAAYVWRERVFKWTVEKEESLGEQLTSAVVVPRFSRNDYYYAVGRKYDAHRGSTTESYNTLRDPNVGYTWRCFPNINRPPYPVGRKDCNDRVCRGEDTYCSEGIGYHKERKVVCTAYEPQSICAAEFADSGQWLETCQTVDGFNQRGMERPTNNSSWSKGNDEQGTLLLYATGHGGPINIDVTGSQVFNHWCAPSPHPITHQVQNISAVSNALGEPSVAYQTAVSTYTGVTKHWGYTPNKIESDDSPPAFIGVLQP